MSVYIACSFFFEKENKRALLLRESRCSWSRNPRTRTVNHRRKKTEHRTQHNEYSSNNRKKTKKK